MRPTVATLAVSSLLLGLGVVPAQAAADPGSVQAVRWEAGGAVVPLAQLSGSSVSYPAGLNAAGVAVGYTDTQADGTPVRLAVRWSATGAVTELGRLPGDTQSEAVGINAAGVAVGVSTTLDGPAHAVRWLPDGTPVRLPDLAGTQSRPVAIADDGTVIGTAFVPDTGQFEAVRWSPRGTPRLLPGIAGSVQTVPWSVSADGRWVTGTSTDGQYFDHPVRWNAAGAVTDLGTAPGYSSSVVTVLDDGTVAGSDHTYDDAAVGHALRWNHAGARSTLAGPAAEAPHSMDMNAGHVVVGYFTDAQGAQTPVRWNRTGAVTVLPSHGGGAGVAVNDAGVVAGNSGGRAVRWSAAGKLTVLALPSGFTEGFAIAINAPGSVLGYVDNLG